MMGEQMAERVAEEMVEQMAERAVEQERTVQNDGRSLYLTMNRFWMEIMW